MSVLTFAQALAKVTWPLAVHEAGHAVVARKMGFSIDYATIVPNGRSHGHVLIEGEIFSRKRAAVSLAGIAAEFVVFGAQRIDSPSDRDNFKKSGLDYKQALRITKALVREHKEEIEALARVLLFFKTMTGAHVEQVLQGVRERRTHRIMMGARQGL